MIGKRRLEIVEPERMNLLGLMMGDVVEANLKTPHGESLAAGLSGKLGVTAGRMKITLHFKRGDISMTRGHAPSLTAAVRGSLDGLLQVSLGRGPLKAFFAGDVTFSGNPFFVLKVLPLVRVQGKGRRPRHDS